jgi:hypothetical protein
LLINVGLKMKPKMKLTVLKCSKSFFNNELMELIVRETNTQYKKYKPEVSFHCVFRLHDWKRVTADEMLCYKC